MRMTSDEARPAPLPGQVDYESFVYDGSCPAATQLARDAIIDFARHWAHRSISVGRYYGTRIDRCNTLVRLVAFATQEDLDRHRQSPKLVRHTP